MWVTTNKMIFGVETILNQEYRVTIFVGVGGILNWEFVEIESGKYMYIHIYICMLLGSFCVHSHSFLQCRGMIL